MSGIHSTDTTYFSPLFSFLGRRSRLKAFVIPKGEVTAFSAKCVSTFFALDFVGVLFVASDKYIASHVASVKSGAVLSFLVAILGFGFALTEMLRLYNGVPRIAINKLDLANSRRLPLFTMQLPIVGMLLVSVCFFRFLFRGPPPLTLAAHIVAYILLSLMAAFVMEPIFQELKNRS